MENSKTENHQIANSVKVKDRFVKQIIHRNISATNNVMEKSFDIAKSTQKSHDALQAMEAHDGLQSMLVAQMLSVHELQQKTMAFALSSSHIENKKDYTNLAVKLTNCFVQQANLLAKLQGIAGQKIIVERVDVHQGGQAIVGTIQGAMGNKEKT
ncbi:TPA: hypothetical protein U0Z67_000826 [Legionella pneumophila]|nr:hypothetical protein [Legionella pneumophila]